MTGKAILAKAVQHLGEPYVLGSIAPKDDPDWSGPWDCAELASWCVYQAAMTLYGCIDNHAPPALADAYTGAWDRDSRYLGHQISVAEAAGIVGACVLRMGPKSGHIVISDGRGGTVEAHSSATGVIRHTLSGRRWDIGIMVRGVKYDLGQELPTVDPAPQGILRLTLPYMRGAMVQQLQEALQGKGCFLGRIDGIFGSLTHRAVLDYQKAHGLVVDGEAGPITLTALGIQ